VETAKYVLDFRKEHKTEFLRRLYDGAKEAGWMTQGEPPMQGEKLSQLVFVHANEGFSPIPELPKPELVAEKEAETAAQEEKAARKKHAEEMKEEAEKEAREAKGLEQRNVFLSGKQRKPPTDTTGFKFGTEAEIVVIQRNPDKLTRRPRELLVRVRLPGVTSAAGVDINIDKEAKTVQVDHLDLNLHAQAALPFPVDDDAGSATFNTDESLLTLMLPVVALPEAENEALAHLERDGALEEADKAAVASSEEEEENAMVRQQRLGGLAMPRKLCTQLLF